MVNNFKENDDRKIFVRKLDFDTTQESIEGYFSQYGEVSEVIMKYNEDGRSKGFCFVVFADKQTVEDVLNMEHEIDSRKLEVKKAGDTGGANATKKLFCGGLPHALTEDQLTEYFSQFGEIENFEFIYDKTTEERKHFCFALFKDASSVEKIVEGKLPPGSVIHHIGTYRVECKKKFEDHHPIQKKVKYQVNQKKAQADEWGDQGWGSHQGYGYAAPAAPRRPRAARGRARGTRARAASHAAYSGYSNSYEDPYAAPYEDPYAEDPYAAESADPYAADPYEGGYEEDTSAYSSYPSRAGGGPMKSRGAAGRARGRGVRGGSFGGARRAATRGARGRPYPNPY